MIRLTRRAFFGLTGTLFPLMGVQSTSAQDVPIEPLDPTPTPSDTDRPETDKVVTPADAGTATASGRYFGDTGHNLKAPFLAKWQITGGRDGIGAPLSEDHFREGIGVCQYFDAVVLVYDPANAAPWDVQATHISTQTRNAIAPGSARKALTAAPRGSGRFFPESGHSLSGKFLDFWEDHGDLPLIGLPTTEAFKDSDTKLETQVFERAVLEIQSGTVRFQPIARGGVESSGLFGDPAFLPSPPVGGSTQLVKSQDGLRLRARPSLEAEILVLLPDNAEFIAAPEESGDWYAGYADGFSGYVAAEFLSVAPPLPEISLSDWNTKIWQGAALGETNVRREPSTTADIVKVLEYGEDLEVSAWVKGEEVFTGADLWAKIGENQFVYARNIGRNAPVADPPLPANAPGGGKWIDVNLTQQLMVAYEGRDVKRIIVTTTGMAGWETPEGEWQILARVPNETMENTSIGAENFYKLEDVLFTQYFSNRGHAIHYAWWRTPQTIGRPGSHGCLNTLFDDARFLWDWATIGTPVITHY